MEMFADIGNWTISPPAPGKVAGLSMFAVRVDNKYPTFQPCLAEALGQMHVVFEPSVYNGTGEEQRVNMVCSIDNEAASAIEAMEADIRDRIRDRVPNVDAIWNSAIRPGERGKTFKTKVRVRGEGAVRCFSRERKDIPIPATWRGTAIVPVVEIRGVYTQRASAGVILETVACILGDNPYVKQIGSATFK